jgi:outer membrane biosynthesis protein TonB
MHGIGVGAQGGGRAKRLGVRCLFALLGVCALAGGAVASAALAGGGHALVALTTTIGADPPPVTQPTPDPPPVKPKPPPPPAPKVTPPPPPAPVHVSPPPPPAPVAPPPPPPPAYVPPPPPPPAVASVSPAPAKPLVVKRNHPRRHVAPAAPQPVSRGAGGPTPIADAYRVLTITPSLPETTLVSSVSPSHDATAALLLALLGGFGLLLLTLALVPQQALRPAAVYYALAPRRTSLAAFGVGIVILVGTMYLING